MNAIFHWPLVTVGLALALSPAFGIDRPGAGSLKKVSTITFSDKDQAATTKSVTVDLSAGVRVVVELPTKADGYKWEPPTKDALVDVAPMPDTPGVPMNDPPLGKSEMTRFLIVPKKAGKTTLEFTRLKRDRMGKVLHIHKTYKVEVEVK